MTATPLDAAGFAALMGVSRETRDRLQAYLDLLGRWQAAINLVGRRSLNDPWRRHVLDSAQLVEHLPEPAGPLLDLGTGAGLPGLVLAILGVPNVHLIESDGRKVAFLREAARVTKTSVTIHATRIEAVPAFPAGVITARGLAPLPELLDLAAPFIAGGTIGLFLKGRTVERELTDAAKHWHMVAHRFMSRSHPEGVVLKLEELVRAPGRQSQGTADRPDRRHRQPEGRGGQDHHGD